MTYYHLPTLVTSKQAPDIFGRTEAEAEAAIAKVGSALRAPETDGSRFGRARGLGSVRHAARRGTCPRRATKGRSLFEPRLHTCLCH